VKDLIDLRNEKFVPTVKKYFDEYMVMIRRVGSWKLCRPAVWGTIKKSDLYGCYFISWTKSEWPKIADLEEKSDEVLRDLRIKTVQWSMIKGEIVSIKITLNDNSESPQFGTKEVDHSLDLPADRPVRYIKFHNDSFFLQSVQFLDDANKVIAEIKGHNSTGKWSLIKFG